MSVNISKLWSNNKFNNLTNNSKLLYIYLVTNPSINSVGVLSINFPVVKAQLGLDIDEIRESSTELIEKNYLYVKKYDSDIYFIIPAHFNTLPKSDSSVLKVTRDLESLPRSLRVFLDNIGISISTKIKVFLKPSKKEVLEYCINQGYNINIDTFMNYYQNEADKRGRSDVWINSKGKVVKDWKATLRNVWFKEENKLKKCKGAPKGYDYFYIDVKGEIITPDGWKNGKPYSKNFIHNKYLIDEWNKISKNS